MSTVSVGIVLVEGAAPPEYQTHGAAGMDLRCREDFALNPMERRAVPTGICIQLPPGYEAQVRPRSGLALRHGVSMVNAPGTIDSDYRGEICVILINLGAEQVAFTQGERIAQLVVAPVSRVEWSVQTELEGTDRGSGGFGSTGT